MVPRKYKSISLHKQNTYKNECFNLNSIHNRDNCYLIEYSLKKKLYEKKINLSTFDLNKSSDLNIYINNYKKVTTKNNILLLWENDKVLPENNLNFIDFGKFKKIYTWNDDLVDNKFFFKFYLPVVDHRKITSTAKKYRFCCCISNNKDLRLYSKKNYYQERIRAIKWFEQNALDHFDLYGSGWNSIPLKYNLLNKFIRIITNYLVKSDSKLFFKSNNGPIKNKFKILSKYKFCICYENNGDSLGYITEKIFDCFFCGVIPVYLGPSNISSFIPDSCFINRVNFSSYEKLFKYLINLSDSEVLKYQQNIKKFLNSKNAKVFFHNYFAESFSDDIVKILNDN
jgi:hypothetical protein